MLVAHPGVMVPPAGVMLALPWVNVAQPGVTVSPSGVMLAHPWVHVAQPGVTVLHSGLMMAHIGIAKTHPGVVKAHPVVICRSPLSPGDSLWTCKESHLRLRDLPCGPQGQQCSYRGSPRGWDGFRAHSRVAVTDYEVRMAHSGVMEANLKTCGPSLE